MRAPRLPLPRTRRLAPRRAARTDRPDSLRILVVPVRPPRREGHRGMLALLRSLSLAASSVCGDAPGPHLAVLADQSDPGVVLRLAEVFAVFEQPPSAT